ncbi:MAG: hemin ABC transporter substrate-binding protein [Deltaproteobacteria bacterium]|nr:MAG: hemin ABC transporter substrate-binding protein [Deltaproteobacteria bacterium]
MQSVMTAPCRAAALRAAVLIGLGLGLAAAGLGCHRDDAAPSPSGRVAAAPNQPAVPPRLVSLTPSATEVVAALDATGWLVGVDDYSTFPPEVARLPRVGSFLAPNLEAIVALVPTLVIVDDIHRQAAGALNDAGVATLSCAVHTLPDIKAALRAVAARIGKAADAERVVAGIDAALDRAAARRPVRRPRVLAVIDREAGGLGNLVTAGPGSWIDELLAVVGGDNVLAAAGVRYPKISAEEVLRARPDVILDLSYAARQGVAAWNQLAVPAVASHRIRALDEPYLAAPSPRVAEALAALTRALEVTE